MRIEASAPTRIDLAGGTLDIWPLYLFHDGAQTLNAAISLARTVRDHVAQRCDASSSIRRTRDRGSQVDHWSALRDHHDLRLLGRLLHFFQVGGVELRTRSESPVGAGIAGSSALNIAVCGALERVDRRLAVGRGALPVAMNVEAQAIDVPTGVQDYRPAYSRRYFGRRARRERRAPGGTRRPRQALQHRLALAYTNASRNSGINNWDVMKRHIDGDRLVQASFDRIRDIAVAMREALERQDWPEVGRQIAAGVGKSQTAGRRRHDIPTSMPCSLRPHDAGAIAGKVCGAGGGGCLFCFGDPEAIPGVRRALADAGARVLDFTHRGRTDCSSRTD